MAAATFASSRPVDASVLLGRMLANVAVEVAGGAVPLLGDLFDVAFKANLRNIALIEEWMRTR